MRTTLVLLATAVMTSIASIASADVKLPACFGDHMVLQRDMPVPVWGWAKPGEEVTVKLAGQTATAKAGKDWLWRVTLKPLTAGGAPLEMTVSGKNSITFADILVGEVWVCSGQSNMQWSVAEANDGAKEVSEAAYPEIRLFNLPLVAAPWPRENMKAAWVACGPQTAGGFSAVGYFFGRELHRELKVPIGLISNPWSGMPAQTFISREAMEANPELRAMMQASDRISAIYDPELVAAEVEKAVELWNDACEQAKAENKPPPPKPTGWGDPKLSPSMPARVYNGMIHPLIPYAIRGAIWYQGESNADRPAEYRELLPTLIKDWRTRWGLGDFPFGVVQLANFMAPQTQPVEESGWAELREVQQLTAQQLPNVGLAVAIDIGDADDIHPRNKQEVGRRLALWALAQTYGKNMVYSGPVFEAMTIKGDTAWLRFTQTGGGLVARGEKLTGFAVAGEDKIFHAAEATIAGETIGVRSDKVAKPVAVRYGWANNPVCNLYNKAGLPASPFRTDR